MSSYQPHELEVIAESSRSGSQDRNSNEITINDLV